ncbi:uncharacterized protein LOC127810136 isoform X1 [Diospyros lotus]|uniref:uncharacterized protein LOC127810136 isoform X1 n=1 Tax=Diospyros lotus TaxID=55363 RepID=UPI0022516156|nr:uncharacterized protein LOC127810136 isoform X1 [Diospyros lotus]
MDASFHIIVVNHAITDLAHAASAIAANHAAIAVVVAAIVAHHPVASVVATNNAVVANHVIPRVVNHVGGSSAAPSVLASISPMQYVKPFPDVSKIELFDGNNFKRWQKRVHSILDVQSVAYALSESKPNEASVDAKLLDHWTYVNKVCRHTIISTLSNELFDVSYPFKEAKKNWDSMNAKCTAGDVGKEKFVIGKFYRWEMVDDKEIKAQINKCHKLLEDLKDENIMLQEEFLASLLIEKLPESWNDYKNQLKHKHKQLSVEDLVVHIIIEETNRKELQFARAKEMAYKANLVQGSSSS